MRFTYVRLKGYIGLYNGSGLDELVLDMSNCKNKIVLISGMNGSGKSTLQSALDILPDPSSCFIPGKPAEKELHILDSSSDIPTIYRILITSPVTKSGRANTKASIQKNGVELNPNGNISSYKEIIFSEFELDGNYITLGRLSSTDRGLAGKNPTERKRFMSCIVDNLEVYNNIYKALNKKSLIFKSNLNNLHTKIQNIGDETKLRTTLSTFQLQLDGVNSDIDDIKVKLGILDNWIQQHFFLNGYNEDEFKQIESDYTQQSRALKVATDSFQSKISKLNCNSVEELQSLSSSTTESISHNKQEIEVLKTKKAGILGILSSIESDKELKQSKIESLGLGINPEIMDQYNDAKANIESSVSYLSTVGFDYENMSIEDIRIIQEVMETILSWIDTFYMDSTQQIIDCALDDNFEKTKYETESYIQNLSTAIDKFLRELEKLESDRDIIQDLDSHRPKDCKIDTCWYINNALRLRKSYIFDDDLNSDIDTVITRKKSQIEKAKGELDFYNYKLSFLKSAEQKRSIFKNLVEFIQNNRTVLYKYPKAYAKFNIISSLLKSHYSFNEFRDMEIFSSTMAALISYRHNTELVDSLKTDIKVLENNSSIIDALKQEIEEAEKKKADLQNQIKSIESGIHVDNELISNASSVLQKIESATLSYENLNTVTIRFNEIKDKYESIKNTNAEAINKIKEREEYQSRLMNLQRAKNDIEPQISRINGMLTMLAEYQTDYNQVKDKYQMIELVKKYTSPSSGIQTLFIEVYMNKALDLANQILSMIFCGEYRLLNFVINQNEFRIPFVGSGLPVDDISSGSTSQICIIGMIINLVLLHQASVKFNIPRLDEIDGGLDSRNKLDFINILYKTSELLGIEQMFMISHSAELELQNVDIIRLRSHEDQEMNPNFNGTVIYDYNQSFSTSGTSL